MDRRSKTTYPVSSMTSGTTRMGQIPQKNDCFACLYAMTKTTTKPVCMYFTFAKSTSIKDEDLEGTDKIRPQYAHERTYDGMTQKIPSKDTIVSLPEEKANSCQRDSECWRVPGACTCIVTDDGVTSMMNAFDRDNAMLGRITFRRT